MGKYERVTSNNQLGPHGLQNEAIANVIITIRHLAEKQKLNLYA
jgi:hypothetical protein